jgi:hypothetical protein
MSDVTPADRAGGDSDAPAVLVGQWAVCAILAGASRFVPVPLLDDAVKSRATRIAVARTLRARGRGYDSERVEPLYAGADRWHEGALKYLRAVPRKVVLFPVRKYVALFGSVRGVPNDVMQVLLLARSTYRVLGRGGLADLDPNLGPAEAKAARRSLLLEAEEVRRAFDEAVENMDLRLLLGALTDGLSQGRSLSSAAVAYARELADRSDHPIEDDDLRPGGPVAAGAEQVEEVLRDPEVKLLLAEFDERFDQRLAARPG